MGFDGMVQGRPLILDIHRQSRDRGHLLILNYINRTAFMAGIVKRVAPPKFSKKIFLWL